MALKQISSLFLKFKINIYITMASGTGIAFIMDYNKNRYIFITKYFQSSLTRRVQYANNQTNDKQYDCYIFTFISSISV